MSLFWMTNKTLKKEKCLVNLFLLDILYYTLQFMLKRIDILLIIDWENPFKSIYKRTFKPISNKKLFLTCLFLGLASKLARFFSVIHISILNGLYMYFLPSPLLCSISKSFLILSSLAWSVCFCVSIRISNS